MIALRIVYSILAGAVMVVLLAGFTLAVFAAVLVLGKDALP